jgi:large subunit ribosomal protein L32
MPPHPKRKHSKGRRDRRRAHDALSGITLVTCPSCGKLVPQHRVCPECGFYQGKEVVKQKKAA